MDEVDGARKRDGKRLRPNHWSGRSELDLAGSAGLLADRQPSSRGWRQPPVGVFGNTGDHRYDLTRLQRSRWKSNNLELAVR
jgi:hypothetical protein